MGLLKIFRIVLYIVIIFSAGYSAFSMTKMIGFSKKTHYPTSTAIMHMSYGVLFFGLLGLSLLVSFPNGAPAVYRDLLILPLITFSVFQTQVAFMIYKRKGVSLRGERDPNRKTHLDSY